MAESDRLRLSIIEEPAFKTPPNVITASPTDCQVIASDNSFNSAADVDFTNVGGLSYQVGQLLYTSGFTDPANNGVFEIVSVAATKIIVKGGTLVDEAAATRTLAQGRLQILRQTGEDLGRDTETVESEELSDNRNVADIIRVNVRGVGGFGLELSYGTHDPILEAALRSLDWSTEVSVTGTVFSMASADNSINRSSGDFVADGFLANQWIKVSGFSGGNAANTAVFKIVSVAATKMVLKAGSKGAVVTEAAGDSVTIRMGEQIITGTTERFFHLEREYTDLTNVFSRSLGYAPNTMALNIATRALVNGNVQFLGALESSAAATVGDGSPNPKTTTRVMNTIDHIVAVLEADAVVKGLEFVWNIGNNLRDRAELGLLGAESIAAGSISLNGTFRALFKGNALFQKYEDFTETSFAVAMQDSAGNAYVLDVPTTLIGNARRNAGGRNTDIEGNFDWIAKEDATEGIMGRLVRWAA